MILDQFRLDDRVAIITGAGRGIGAGIATAFAEAGADVVLGARSAEQLADVSSEVEKVGRRAVAIAGDLRTRDGMEALVTAAVTAFGRIDIVVNNAGGTAPSPFQQTSEEQFDAALRWNITTAFNLSQLALPHLLTSGHGGIINIASDAGHFSGRGNIAYGTSKAAVLKLTQQLAQELAPKVRVNSISPGPIRTSALDSMLTSPEIEASMTAAVPLHRLGLVTDIAAAAVYLASDASSFVTSRDIRVDGGLEPNALAAPYPDL